MGASSAPWWASSAPWWASSAPSPGGEEGGEVGGLTKGGAGQEGQAGRARQKAGGPTANRRVGRMMGGAPMADDDDTDSCSGRCNCSAGRRRLIVRHPLQQLELLIDESAARLPPAA